MTSVNTKNPFLLSNMQPLKSLGEMKATKLPPEMAARMEEMWKTQFRVPVGKPDNDAGNIYATVKKDGKIIATLYNSGAAETSNATYAKVDKLPSMTEKETDVGPVLAQKRAEEIAKKMGGTIDKASTAQTQSQWLARPPMEWTYDYNAMNLAQMQRNDALRSGLETKTATSQTKTDAQMLAQSDDGVASQFLDIIHQNPVERIRAQILRSKGLTEESLAGLPPEEQAKIEEEILALIKEEIEKKTGGETAAVATA